jgi:hypothetical protein
MYFEQQVHHSLNILDVRLTDLRRQFQLDFCCAQVAGACACGAGTSGARGMLDMYVLSEFTVCVHAISSEVRLRGSQALVVLLSKPLPFHQVHGDRAPPSADLESVGEYYIYIILREPFN